MKFYRNNWYYIGGVYFVALAFIMGFFGSGISDIQVVLIYSFMALLLHQFEEYALPGGFPAVFNIAFSKERENPDRYPLNKNSSLVVNVFLAYPLYIIPIFLPNVIWLGLIQVLAGVAQIFVHGISINMKMKSLYNPGLAAVVFLHIPIAIYYIWFVVANGLVGIWDFAGGLIGVVAAAILLILMPVKLLQNRQSKYPWSEKEMARFNVVDNLKSKGLL